LFTDLGHVFPEIQEVIGTLDAVLIESNYDDEMLRTGPYPQHLKNRISGKRGHLSNTDAAELLDTCDASQLQWACLGHLSAQNNSPDVALATHRQKLGNRFSLFCADRYDAMQLPKIKEPKFALRAACRGIGQ
jgi:phosphoribosyl 1,2-cyclic phosphodiesterase